jgi:hypothetical protein
MGVACSGGSDEPIAPKGDVTPTESSEKGDSGTRGLGDSGAAGSSGSSSDAGAKDAQASDANDGGGTAKDPGCDEACAKAYACKMVATPKSCVCGGKAGSVECAKCWLSHTCDELKNYACYGACN